MKNIGICQLQQDLGGSTYPTQNEADMAEISVQFFHDHCYVVIINKYENTFLNLSCKTYHSHVACCNEQCIWADMPLL